MPKWLTKAKSAFKTPEPLPPEPFRLVCACGGVIDGTRSDVEQRVRCGECGHEMFVLPESVYPPPEVDYRRRRNDEDVEVEVELIEEPSAAKPLPPGPADAIKIAPDKKQRPRKKKKASGDSAQEASAASGGTRADEAPAVDVDLRKGIRDLRTRRRKIITPFRAIVIGITLVLVFTGYAVIHSRAVAKAEVVRTQSAKLGRQALDDGDLETAVAEFAKVQDALETLGEDAPEAAELHQLYLETNAAGHLMPSSFRGMIEKIGDAAGVSKDEDVLDSIDRGQWVVIDASIRRDHPGADVWVTMPLLADNDSAAILVAGSAFGEMILDGVDQRVIFAGRLESCHVAGKKQRVWQIRLAEDSVFCWANPKTYQLVGFTLDPETIDVLKAQADVLGVAP